MLTPTRLSSRSSCRNIRNKGPIIAITGKKPASSTNPRIRPRPRIGSRAIAYPASEATTSVTAVVSAETITLARMFFRKPSCVMIWE